VAIDTLLGAVPALGDLFDAAWKSNTKNVALLERHLAVDRGAGTGRKRGSIGMIALILVALVIILGAGLALGIYVARLLWSLGTR
jgi:amino acid transporter